MSQRAQKYIGITTFFVTMIGMVWGFTKLNEGDCKAWKATDGVRCRQHKNQSGLEYTVCKTLYICTGGKKKGQYKER